MPRWVSAVTVFALLAAGAPWVAWGTDVSPNFRAIQGHQDHVLRTLEKVTRPVDRVLDGFGWGVDRESAFVFWFLPRLVRVLMARRAIAPLTEEDLRENPPGAIVMDSRTVLYLKQVRLEPFISANFLPLEQAIWVPGMSGKMERGEEKSWTVMVGGRYRIVEMANQARNPWFLRPFDFPRTTEGPTDRFVVDVRQAQEELGQRRVAWDVNGGRVDEAETRRTVVLSRGSRLTARNTGDETVAVFVVPQRWDRILTMPCFPSGFEILEKS